jgi:hypothetical protein
MAFEQSRAQLLLYSGTHFPVSLQVFGRDVMKKISQDSLCLHAHSLRGRRVGRRGERGSSGFVHEKILIKNDPELQDGAKNSNATCCKKYPN